MNERRFRIAQKTILILFYPLMMPVMLLVYYPMARMLSFGLSRNYTEYKEDIKDLNAIMKNMLIVRI